MRGNFGLSKRNCLPCSEPSPAPPAASWTGPPATDAGEMDGAAPALMHAGPVRYPVGGCRGGLCRGRRDGPWSIPFSSELQATLPPGTSIFQEGPDGWPLRELGHAHLWLSAQSKLRERKQVGSRPADRSPPFPAHCSQDSLYPPTPACVMGPWLDPSPLRLRLGSGSSSLAAVQRHQAPRFFSKHGARAAMPRTLPMGAGSSPLPPAFRKKS